MASWITREIPLHSLPAHEVHSPHFYTCEIKKEASMEGREEEVRQFVQELLLSDDTSNLENMTKPEQKKKRKGILAVEVTTVHG